MVMGDIVVFEVVLVCSQRQRQRQYLPTCVFSWITLPWIEKDIDIVNFKVCDNQTNKRWPRT